MSRKEPPCSPLSTDGSDTQAEIAACSWLCKMDEQQKQIICTKSPYSTLGSDTDDSICPQISEPTGEHNFLL